MKAVILLKLKLPTEKIPHFQFFFRHYFTEKKPTFPRRA
jgi:hypothetical protein